MSTTEIARTLQTRRSLRLASQDTNNITTINIQTYRDVPIRIGAIAFILPCHNEADDLRIALGSVQHQQNVTIDTILVVSDNSTDDTVAIARSMGVSVIETEGNTFKKAGALNAGIRHLMHEGSLPEYIITGDGDTEYDRNFVVRAVNVMKITPRLGVLSAVCYGKSDLLAFPRWPARQSTSRHVKVTNLTIVQKMLRYPLLPVLLLLQWTSAFVSYGLVWLQRAEYARAAMLRLRQNIHTMSGAGSVLRTKAIVDVLYDHQRIPHGIQWKTVALYREHDANLVEDFALTLDIKRAGWNCTNNFYVVAHTDLMRDLPSLLRQRTRWVRGTIDELRRRRYSHESRLSSVTVVYGLVCIPIYYLFIGLVAIGVSSGNAVITDFWMFPLMGAYQALMIRKMGWKSMSIAFLLVPEMLYGILRHYWIIVSLSRSYLSNNQTWE